MTTDELRGYARTAERLAERADDLARLTATEDEVPCEQRGLAGTGASCCALEHDRPLTREERAKGWERRPFDGYETRRLCAACRAYWHQTQAAHALHDLARELARELARAQTREGHDG